MLESILNKLIPDKPCEHQWIDASTIHISKLFPDYPDLQNFSIYVTGLEVKECLKCKSVKFSENEKNRIGNLKNVGQHLITVYRPKQRITLTFGDLSTFSTNNISNHKLDAKKAEETSFKVTSPRFGMEAVILNELTAVQIEEAEETIKNHDLYYRTWGWEKVRPYGQSTILNFHGPSGTGKTRTAEALAKLLGLKFIDVSIADLESRFMSQTGKNIQSAFEIATKENALLFFDEADTVLGKRLSSVTNGTDAEINMARSTMLKELEDFKGVCVFATNFPENIDIAFVRRIAYHIEFGLPTPSTLKKLWDFILLDTIPIEKSKEEVIELLTTVSQGLSGADIATAIELTFPKATRNNRQNPILLTEHLLESINQVKSAKANIGKKKPKTDDSEEIYHYKNSEGKNKKKTNLERSLFGLSNK